MRSSNILPLLLCAVLCGCQGYVPLSLDLDAHHAAWTLRSPEDAQVAAYAARLAEADPGRAAYDPSDGLSLHEAELVALVLNPSLRTARLEARVPALGAAETGRWADPTLSFDAMRIAESVDEPWILGGSLGFTIPISGRLAMAKQLALAEADLAMRRALRVERSTIAALREAWVRWSQSVHRIELVASHLDRVNDVVELAAKQRQADRLGAPQLRALQIEKVGRTGEIEALRVEIERRRRLVLALTGLAAETPIDLHPTVVLEAPSDDGTTLNELLRVHNLELAIARAKFEVADRALRLELRKQYPDLEIGPAYEDDDGTSRVGVTLEMPVPVFDGNRRGVVEAQAAREAAKAAFEAEYERLVSAVQDAKLGATAARRRSAWLGDQVAPLVDQQLEDLDRLGALGQIDVLVTLDALTRGLETRTRMLDARVEEAMAVNGLRALVEPGPAIAFENDVDESE